jgi:hypothetical protein
VARFPLRDAEQAGDVASSRGLRGRWDASVVVRFLGEEDNQDEAEGGLKPMCQFFITSYGILTALTSAT